MRSCGRRLRTWPCGASPSPSQIARPSGESSSRQASSSPTGRVRDTPISQPASLVKPTGDSLMLAPSCGRDAPGVVDDLHSARPPPAPAAWARVVPERHDAVRGRARPQPLLAVRVPHQGHGFAGSVAQRGGRAGGSPAAVQLRRERRPAPRTRRSPRRARAARGSPVSAAQTAFQIAQRSSRAARRSSGPAPASSAFSRSPPASGPGRPAHAAHLEALVPGPSPPVGREVDGEPPVCRKRVMGIRHVTRSPPAGAPAAAARRRPRRAPARAQARRGPPRSRPRRRSSSPRVACR